MSQDALMPFNRLFAPQLRSLFQGKGQVADLLQSVQSSQRANAGNPFSAGVKNTGLGGLPQGLRVAPYLG